MEVNQDSKIYYITDVEGNVAWFRRCIALCRDGGIGFEDEAQSILKLAENCYFVFGGDAFDKGRDLEFGWILIRAKQRYPDRVFLIIGNRDSNKMKLSSELDHTDIARPLDHITGPYWVDPRERMTFKMYLKELITADGHQATGADFDEAIYTQYHTVVNKAKWLLIHTMGCPKTFEFRRDELQAQQDGQTVPDGDVAHSFLRETQDGGVYREYLRHGQVGCIIGNTLFVHGCISESNAFFIPGPEFLDDNQTPDEAKARGNNLRGQVSLKEWIDLLNTWAQSEIADWMDEPVWNEARTRRGGRSFSGYNYFPCANVYTMVINDWWNLKRLGPIAPSKELAELLLAGGISRVVSGHRPFGDSPTIMRQHGLEVIVADTSYSDMSADDSRGKALYLISINGDIANDNSTRIWGQLKDARPFDFNLPLCSTDQANQFNDTLIGTELDDRYWVKAMLEDGSYVAMKADGRNISYKTIPKT